MSYEDTLTADEPAGALDQDLAAEGYPLDERSSLALFDGDEGTLDRDQRDALVYVLKQRFLSSTTHPRQYATLAANPRPIASRLNDLYLELVIDTQAEVAYKRPVTPEAGGRSFPTLVYDAPWSREETLLLIGLRARYRNETAAGAEKVFWDREDMYAHLEAFQPLEVTDRAGEAARARRAVESIYKTGLLIGPSDGDRFEISNAIEVLLPLPKLVELLAWMRRRNAAVTDDLGLDQAGPEPSSPNAPGEDQEEEYP